MSAPSLQLCRAARNKVNALLLLELLGGDARPHSLRLAAHWREAPFLSCFSQPIRTLVAPSVLRMHVSSVSSFPCLSPPSPPQVDPPLRCDLFLPVPPSTPTYSTPTLAAINTNRR
jgi:hypothetical protein